MPVGNSNRMYLDILHSYFVHIHIYFSRQWRYGRLFHSRCRTWSLLNFEAPVSLFLQSIELPLKKQPCFPAYWSPIFSYFSIIYKPAESALCPIVWAVNRDIKQYWPKYQSLTNWQLVTRWILCYWMQPFKPDDSECFSLALSSINPINISIASL